MDEQEWLRRIDEHLETSKGYMRDGHELMARNERAFLDLQSYLRDATKAIGLMVTELRQRRREQHESWQEWREEWRAFHEESRSFHDQSRAFHEESRASQEESRAVWHDWREESRVVREALFAILDRLNNEPPPSAA